MLSLLVLLFLFVQNSSAADDALARVLFAMPPEKLRPLVETNGEAWHRIDVDHDGMKIVCRPQSRAGFPEASAGCSRSGPTSRPHLAWGGRMCGRCCRRCGAH